MTDHRRKAITATFVVAACLLTLSACDATAIAPGTYACASWVPFDTPQKQYDEAELVVVGVVGPGNGSVGFETGPGERHEIELIAVHKGEVEGDTLNAASPRDYCVENPPDPAEDPLQEGDRVLLFLRAVGDDWSTLTPMAGVIDFPEGTALPFTAS